MAIGNYQVNLLMNELGNIIVQIKNGQKLIFNDSYYLFNEIFLHFKDKIKNFLENPEILAFFKKHNESLFPSSPDHEFHENNFISKLQLELKNE